MEKNTILDIVLMILIGVTFWLQREQIKSLKTEVQSYQNINQAMKSLMEIINIDQIKQYVAMKDEKNKFENEKKIEELRKSLTDAHIKIVNKMVPESTAKVFFMK